MVQLKNLAYREIPITYEPQYVSGQVSASTGGRITNITHKTFYFIFSPKGFLYFISTLSFPFGRRGRHLVFLYLTMLCMVSSHGIGRECKLLAYRLVPIGPFNISSILILAKLTI